eukprot:16448149-Heterocapsa_arctica.AAC.1
MRSLQNGTVLEVKDAASWLTHKGCTEADRSGQSHWSQAQANWCPMITVGCTVPYFLRGVLV